MDMFLLNRYVYLVECTADMEKDSDKVHEPRQSPPLP